MPRLRPRPKDTAPATAPAIEGAICTESHRPWPISDFIERGTRLAVDHPAVKANPQYFMGLVRLTEEV